MTTVPPWWAGLAPAEVEVTCAGVTHRVRWEAGRLAAVDHRDSVAEEALVALGGDAPPCLELVEAWQRQTLSPELVTLGRRPGELDVGFPPDENLGKNVDFAVRPGMPAQAVATITALIQRRDDLVRLLAMPGPMIDRLVLTVLAKCSERWHDEDFRADHGLRLGAALAVRATPALRRFGLRLECGPVDIGVSPVRPDGNGPVIAARLEPQRPVVVSAELPIEWLSNVWGRGLSEPDGHFVLAVTGGSDDGREFAVFVAEWENAGPITFEAVARPAVVTTDDAGRRRVVLS